MVIFALHKVGFKNFLLVDCMLRFPPIKPTLLPPPPLNKLSITYSYPTLTLSVKVQAQRVVTILVFYLLNLLSLFNHILETLYVYMPCTFPASNILTKILSSL